MHHNRFVEKSLDPFASQRAALEIFTPHIGHYLIRSLSAHMVSVHSTLGLISEVDFVSAKNEFCIRCGGFHFREPFFSGIFESAFLGDVKN